MGRQKAIPRYKHLARDALAGDRYAACLFIRERGCKTLTEMIWAVAPTGKLTPDQFAVLHDGWRVFTHAQQTAALNAVLQELDVQFPPQPEGA